MQCNLKNPEFGNAVTSKIQNQTYLSPSPPFLFVHFQLTGESKIATVYKLKTSESNATD